MGGGLPQVVPLLDDQTFLKAEDVEPDFRAEEVVFRARKDKVAVLKDTDGHGLVRTRAPFNLRTVRLRLDQDRSLPRDSLQQISTRSRAGHCHTSFAASLSLPS